MHKSTFEYLLPSDSQVDDMSECRAKFGELCSFLDETLPRGPDKTYILRKLRECAMWTNICITREADGSPRE